MRRRTASPFWIFTFIIIQCLSVSMLAIELLSPVRLALRVTPFALGIFYLIILGFGALDSQLKKFSFAVVAITAFGIFNPYINSYFSAVAQIGLTLSVWSPIFWVDRIRISIKDVQKICLILWLFNSLSAFFGVLQVYYPERFAIDLSFSKQITDTSFDGLKITLDDGTQLIRPTGLSDSPGGAALAANTAIIMGVGTGLVYRSLLLRLMIALTIILSLFSLYICQVRSLLILTGLSIFAMSLLLVFRGRLVRALAIYTAALIAIVISFAWATSVGSNAVNKRLDTLTESSVAETYYTNRGVFLEKALFDDLFEYPLGAGPGRWGMMAYYFGDKTNWVNPMLWAEITVSGWVYDGGLPLLIVGYGAMLIGFVSAVRIAILTSSDSLSNFASIVAAVSLGCFAATISSHVFVTQQGMIYLMLLSVLLVVNRSEELKPRLKTNAPPER